MVSRWNGVSVPTLRDGYDGRPFAASTLAQRSNISWMPLRSPDQALDERRQRLVFLSAFSNAGFL
jgi:hypothetical protein